MQYFDPVERLSATFPQLLKFSLNYSLKKRFFIYLHAQLSQFQCYEPYVL